jgi:uncharacterized integral membrane protein (TIGR00697 family)
MVQAQPPIAVNPRHYKYYDLVMAAFVTVLLCSNLIGPGKICALTLPFSIPLIGSVLKFGAGNIFFPISYIFDDVLTEVYGYARSRKVIWAGFAAMAFASIMGAVVIHLPFFQSPPDLPKGMVTNQERQTALEICFGSTWRIVIASMIGFWVGDFANSYVLAKMKIWTRGKFLWTRTIGSTIIGEGLDSLIFYPIAFYGIWTTEDMLAVIGINWVFKVAMEVILTPATYAVVGFLKRAESEDYYDRNTNFTPFSLSD